MLLYGVGAQHVINFLAVLDIPMPMPDDTSLVVPSAPDNIASSVASPPTNSVAMPTASPSASATHSHITQSQDRGAEFASGGADSPEDSESLIIPPDEIKEESVEEPRVCGDPDHQDPPPPKKPRGKKRKAPSSRKKKKKQKTQVPRIAAEEASDLMPVDAELPEAGESGSSFFGVSSLEAEDMLAESTKSALRKYYRCPLCPRILPSSRGFNIHVGRKHQVSNYQGNFKKQK